MNHRSVSQITAKGVLNSFDFEIPFASGDSRMQVIYAENGFGKTNLLRAVSLVLQGGYDSLEQLIEVPVRFLEVKFSDGATLTMTKGDAFSANLTLTATIDGEPRPFSIEASELTGRLAWRSLQNRNDFQLYMEAAKKISVACFFVPDSRLNIPLDGEEQDRGYTGSASVRRRASDASAVTQLFRRVERTLSQLAFSGLSTTGSSSGVYAEIARRTLVPSRSSNAALHRRRWVMGQDFGRPW